uniref:Uncharacterized protein n=1 Tax=Methanosarcina barkeri (strain Fusaro / DSM 804) TaxID=269797 RepID=Q46FQ3_METBF
MKLSYKPFIDTVAALLKSGLRGIETLQYREYLLRKLQLKSGLRGIETYSDGKHSLGVKQLKSGLRGIETLKFSIASTNRYQVKIRP